MKRIEIILAIGVLLGIIGNLFWIPNSVALFGICCSLLSSLYFYLGFALFNDIRLKKIFQGTSYTGISISRILGSLGLGMALSIIIIGVMFKFLILPGSHELLLIGISYLCLITLVAATQFVRKDRRKSLFYLIIFKRIISVLIIGIFTYWLPFDSLIDVRYRNRQDYGEILKRSLKDPNNEQIIKELQQERARMLEK